MKKINTFHGIIAGIALASASIAASGPSPPIATPLPRWFAQRGRSRRQWLEIRRETASGLSLPTGITDNRQGRGSPGRHW